MLLIISCTPIYGQDQVLRTEIYYYNFSYLLATPGDLTKNLSKNMKYNYPIFIHAGDSIKQLGQVQVYKKGEPVTVEGTIKSVEKRYKYAYKDLLEIVTQEECKRCVYRLKSTTYPYAGQIHLYVDSTVLMSNSPVQIKEEQITKYLLYKNLSDIQRGNLTPEQEKNKALVNALAGGIPAAVGTGILVWLAGARFGWWNNWFSSLLAEKRMVIIFYSRNPL